MGLSASDIPVIAKQEPFTVSAAQLRTAHDIIEAEEKCSAAVYDGGHQLLAVKITTYDPYEKAVSLIRRDGLIVHETNG